MTEIRQEQHTDIDAIRQLHQIAFEGDVEAHIIDALRSNCDHLLSLVALENGRLVGHILFSPTTIETEHCRREGMALAPMAVHPQFQRRGIGTRLVERGLALLRKRGTPFIIVLGHPGYYPRFGFVPASRLGIRCQWKGVPDEAFMVLLFDQALRDKLVGTARYRREFTPETASQTE